MADRIIPRHDTMARWAEVNPILMEGEWGIVTDSPSLYKVGDGLTAWNDLPFRGYDGTIVQNEGNSTRSVMSQNAVSTRLASANANIAELQNDVAARYTKQEVDAKGKKLREDVDAEYAKKDGAYPKMTAGFAENIVGDGSATPEVFSFRPTAGEERNVENTTILYDGAKNGEAKIKVLKGNSVVWNQCCGQGGRGDARISWENNILTINGEFTSEYSVYDTMLYNAVFKSAVANHKYYILVELVSGTINGGEILYYINPLGRSHPLSANKKIEILSNVTSSGYWFARTLRAGTNCENAKIKHTVYDLTQMFGAGNEPTTIAEFYERLPKGVDIYAFNRGEIADGNYKAIKTTGYNQWDEQWEAGSIDGSTGKNSKYADSIRSSNYISALPNTKYFFHVGRTCSITICCYDAKYNFLGNIAWGAKINIAYTTLPNTSYIRFGTFSSSGVYYGNVYQNDICISLAWSEYTDMQGLYLPYKSFVRDLSWINKYFPATINGETKYGVRSAGSAHDEIRFNSTTQKWEAVQRIGVVDLGSLKWDLRSEDANTFYTSIPNKSVGGDVIVSKYTNVGPLNNILILKDKEVGTTNSNTNIFIKDSTYTDANALKSALQGVMLNYELATPIINEIEENINMDFDCADYGTEELIVTEGEKSAPLSADIIYQPNAVQTLKQVPDILRRLNALESAMAQQTTNVEPSNVEE